MASVAILAQAILAQGPFWLKHLYKHQAALEIRLFNLTDLVKTSFIHCIF